MLGLKAPLCIVMDGVECALVSNNRQYTQYLWILCPPSPIFAKDSGYIALPLLPVAFLDIDRSDRPEHCLQLHLQHSA